MAIYKDVEPLEVVAYKGESEEFDKGVTFILEKLDTLPTADVAELKQGMWIFHYDELSPANSTIECSSCCKEERMSIRNKNYCPNCGADMRGGKEE